MDKLTAKHFIYLILGTAVVSLKSYPTTFMRDSQRDSWIAVLISSALILLVMLYVIGIWRRHNHPGFVQVYQTALGKVGGTVMLSLFILGLFVTIVECASVEADAMHQNILLKTPPWYLMLFFIIPCIYLLRKNTMTILIMAIVALTIISLSGFTLMCLTFINKHPSMLLPMFERGLTHGFVEAIVKSFGLYGCVMIALPYLSMIDDQKNKISKTAFWGMIILIQMQILSVAGLTMTFGPSLYSMNYPKLQETQLVGFMQFLEFGELYVLLQTIGGWLIKYMLTFYAILLIMRELNVPKKFEDIVIFGGSAAVLVLSYFATRNSFRFLEILNLYSFFCLVIFIVIPVIVFAIFSARAGKKAGT